MTGEKKSAEGAGAPEDPGGLVGERTTAVGKLESVVTGHEDGATLREDAAGLREAAASLFSVLLEATPDAIVVVDQTSTIVLVNVQSERLFGYRRDELLGQSVDILMPERFRSAHRGHRASYLRAPSLRLMGAGIDLHAVRKDGQEFPVEISLSPIETNTGKLVISAIRDVTAQHAARRTINEERERIMAAREETANMREEATRLREEAASLREVASTHREEALRAREEVTHARSELEQLMAQMREANEHLVVGTLRAQTMTEVAEEASQAKDEFLAAVSHELRTPLNAIVGWAQVLGGKAPPPDLAGKAIAAIQRNAWALAHLIEDLMDVSRFAAGTIRMATQPVDLVAVAQAALETVRPLAITNNVQLVFSPDPMATQSVSGDAGRLEQVIWNLVANAIKFTPEDGRVEVFITRSGDHMQIRVVDTGKGIDPALLPHVFARFRQGDDATTGRRTGLGLGLSIVRQLVELHGGTVHAASEGTGRGATFTVRLPISEPDQAIVLTDRRTPPPTATSTSRLPRLDGLRILVVDDSADGRILTSLVLTQAGGSVKAATSAREALEMIKLERPDTLVTEIALPGEDGYELIRQIRQHEADHGGLLPAVALTSYTRAEDRARVLAAGFQVHLSKPVDPIDLTAAIATMTHHPSNSDA